MTDRFCERLTRGSEPYERDRGDEATEGYGDLAPALQDLIRGAAGSSPYLAGLLRKERDWAARALDGAPEDARDAVLSDLADIAVADLKPELRRAKRRLAILTALADLGGVWNLDEVTAALTDFADRAVDVTLTGLVAREAGRGRLPEPARPARAGGLAALAMGKMGAFELNYSSDIDLICLFDDSLYSEDVFLEARAGFVRVVRALAQTLSELTSDGYVFRTDLRLRPDAAVTPVCLPMDAAEHYYESMGRTWERAAYIKARAAAGDRESGAAFLDRLTPFVWRRHLDYAAIQDAQDMRLKIHEHKRLTGRSDLPGYDIKLGPGGIREIEFFTQTRQMIAGGRDPSLRARRTVDALASLAQRDWVDEDVARQLTEDYRAHRELEHRLQMIDDQQTQSLPRDAAGFDRVAALMGLSAEALKHDIQGRLGRVTDLTEDFFTPSRPRQETPDLSEAAREIVTRWPSYPALRSQRAVALFDRVRPELLRRVARATHPDDALRHIDSFLAGLPAGVQVFALFDANPGLLDLIVDIADVSPELAAYLSRNSAVLDAVIGGGFFSTWPGVAALTAELSAALDRAGDYERKLDAARVWTREWHFRIGVHLLRGLIDAETAGREYAELAETVIAALAPHVVAEFAQKHGSPPGRGVAFLAMGSLGAARLTATSDLDLIAIFDAGNVEASDGPRPLAARAYYARLTQAMVTALTAPMAEGRLYEVDMRLRPSGRQGPVATSLSAFAEYQAKDAWTWEHLALTRARQVAGPPDIGADFEAVRTRVLSASCATDTVRADVVQMRRRLVTAKPSQGPLDPKFGPGRMQDIELLAQAAALVSGSAEREVGAQLAAGGSALGLSPEEIGVLIDGHAFFWRLQSAARLIGPAAGTPDALGPGARRFLTGTVGAEDFDTLASSLSEIAAVCERLVDRALGSAAQAG